MFQDIGVLVFAVCTGVSDRWLSPDWPVLVGVLGGVVVYVVRKTMYPVGVVLVGAGTRRAERAKWLRVVVLAPLLLGLLGSAIWALVSGPTSN